MPCCSCQPPAKRFAPRNSGGGAAGSNSGGPLQRRDGENTHMTSTGHHAGMICAAAMLAPHRCLQHHRGLRGRAAGCGGRAFRRPAPQPGGKAGRRPIRRPAKNAPTTATNAIRRRGRRVVRRRPHHRDGRRRRGSGRVLLGPIVVFRLFLRRLLLGSQASSCTRYRTSLKEALCADRTAASKLEITSKASRIEKTKAGDTCAGK